MPCLLWEFREFKNLSQGDIGKTDGPASRLHISGRERPYVPGVETLEKYARALEVPMYRFSYQGRQPPKKPSLRAESGGKE